MQYKHLLVFRHELVSKVKNKNQNNYSRLEMIQWKDEASLIVKTAVISENQWPPSMEKHWQLVQVNSDQDKPRCFHCEAFPWKQLCSCFQFPLQYSPVCTTALHLKWVQRCSRRKAPWGRQWRWMWPLHYCYLAAETGSLEGDLGSLCTAQPPATLLVGIQTGWAWVRGKAAPHSSSSVTGE